MLVCQNSQKKTKYSEIMKKIITLIMIIFPFIVESMVEVTEIWENRSIIQIENNGNAYGHGNGAGHGNKNGIGNGNGNGLENNPNIPEPSTYALIFGLTILFYVLNRNNENI